MIDISLARKRAEDALERANREIATQWSQSARYPVHLSAVPALAQDLLQALKELQHWKANHDEMKLRNDFLRSRPDMHYKDVHEHNHRLEVLDQLDAALKEIERLTAASSTVTDHHEQTDSSSITTMEP